MVRAPLRMQDRSAPSRGTPALASRALAQQLNAPPHPATVVGTSTDYAWCAVGDEVVFLASLAAVRFPNAVLADARWGRLEPGEEVVVGSGRVVGRAGDCRVVRWWTPTVTPAPATDDDVRAAVDWLGHRLTTPPTGGLEAALASGDRIGVVDRARRFLGFGSGLTPEGDDLLVGIFAAFRHVTTSLGRPDAARVLATQADELVARASMATTQLSVTLLTHALAGRVAGPVADLLRATTGQGELGIALDRCLAIGSSSGRAFANGVLAGARAAREAVL